MLAYFYTVNMTPETWRSNICEKLMVWKVLFVVIVSTLILLYKFIKHFRVSDLIYF